MAGSGNRCANASGCKDGEMSWIVVFCRKRETSCVLYAFFLPQRFIEEMKDSLYSEGLVFRYSSKPYNNLAATRKNFEQNYLLDYLRHPLIEDQSHFSSGIHILGNYIIAFSPLLRFYQMSGDKNQYIRLKSLLQSILDYSTPQKDRKCGDE